mgnify:CR=1 FL=1
MSKFSPAARYAVVNTVFNTKNLIGNLEIGQREIGKESIINSDNNSRLVAFQMLDRGIPRHDYEIQFRGEQIGSVTSGTQSFILKSGIGLGYVNIHNASIGNEIDIIIRDNGVKAEIIKPPFIKNTSLLD